MGASRDLWMTTVNLCEVWYSIARKKSAVAADEALELIALSRIRVVPADWALTYQAAQFKSRHRISYADAFAAALAHTLGVELATGDPEFKALEGEIKIRWLSNRK
ncbi:MAG: PIN domain-containing protein [Bryobacteraceae bacterium]